MGKNFIVRRGQFYYVDLPKNNGHVQGGIRPVVIISNLNECKYSPTLKVCACTSQEKKFLPTHINIGIISNQLGNNRKNCTILTEQIFTINRYELKSYIGNLTKDQIKKLDKCLTVSIGLIDVRENNINPILKEIEQLQFTLKILEENSSRVNPILIADIRKKIEYNVLKLENTCRLAHLNVNDYYNKTENILEEKSYKVI